MNTRCWAATICCEDNSSRCFSLFVFSVRRFASITTIIFKSIIVPADCLCTVVTIGIWSHFLLLTGKKRDCRGEINKSECFKWNVYWSIVLCKWYMVINNECVFTRSLSHVWVIHSLVSVMKVGQIAHLFIRPEIVRPCVDYSCRLRDYSGLGGDRQTHTHTQIECE